MSESFVADGAVDDLALDANVDAGRDPAGRVHALIDRLATVYASGPFRGEAAAAKDQFFERAGKVFDDDAELFEGRLASFLEWFVLERPLTEAGVPPVLHALGRNVEGTDPDARAALAALATSHRSLFEVVAVDGHEVDVEDVLGGARFRVTERRSTAGFEPGELLEARLVWDGERVIFGKTFLFHPADARESILDVVDRELGRGAGRDDLLFQLSRLHVRWHRQGHVGAAKIYRGE